MENDDLTELAQGEDLYKVEYAYKEKGRGNWIIDKVDVKWNLLFSKTCTILIDEAKEEDYKSRIDSYINYILKLKKPNHDEVKVIADSFMSILIQFKALGLIEKSIRKRLLKDGSTYWKLTNKGDHEITKLRAIPKAKKDAI